jgi:hypothetical protein
MDWLPMEKPSAPRWISVSGSPQKGLNLHWQDSLASAGEYYVVYRFENDEPVNLEDATRIQVILPRNAYGQQSWTDKNLKKHATYRYVVTSVGRLHHESDASAIAAIRTRGKKKQVSGF